jgi:hypothetical protein
MAACDDRRANMSSTHKCRRTARLRRAVFAAPLALAALAGPAQALTTYCATNAQELHDALLAAPGVADNVQVKIRIGSFDAAAAGGFSVTQTQANQTITISGGWIGFPNGCTQRNGLDTVLVGAINRTALYLNTGNSSGGNLLQASDLTLRNPSYSSAAIGACLQGQIAANDQMLVERINSEQCYSTTSSSPAAFFDNTDGQLIVRDFVARDSQSPTGGGIGVDTYNSGVSRLAQLSVSDNRATSGGSIVAGLYLGNFGGGTTYLSNSVVWGNDADAVTKDLYLSGAGTNLTRVHYGKLGGTLPSSNIQSGSGDPGFVAVNDLHLRGDSILIDSGVANPQGGSGNYDLDGRARVLGAAVDVGAYESEFIFVDGFD